MCEMSIPTKFQPCSKHEISIPFSQVQNFLCFICIKIICCIYITSHWFYRELENGEKPQIKYVI